MKPLLKISTIPIKIEMQTRRASLQKPSPSAESQPSYEMRRQRGGMRMRQTQAKVNIDQTAARNNTGLRNATKLSNDYERVNFQAAREATQQFIDTGNAIVDSAGRGNPVIEAAVNAIKPLAPQPDYGPAQPEFQVEPASVEFDYQMDSLTFDWNVHNKPALEYVPASIEYNVAQYPQVVIEYVGEPIYVPESANPKYQGRA
jgi:hypothetical protein